MKKLQIRRLVVGCGLFVMGLLCMAEVGHASPYDITPPVTLDIIAPHNAPGGNAHNTVMFTITNVQLPPDVQPGPGSVDVTISGSETQSQTYTVKLNQSLHVDVPANRANNGRVAGNLRVFRMGQTTILVTFNGTINGWLGYGAQSAVKFSQEKPLTVGTVSPVPPPVTSK